MNQDFEFIVMHVGMDFDSSGDQRSILADNASEIHLTDQEWNKVTPSCPLIFLAAGNHSREHVGKKQSKF